MVSPYRSTSESHNLTLIILNKNIHHMNSDAIF
jgi:hypothetical protein